MRTYAGVHSIEADPRLERDLRFVKRFDYRICVASDEAGSLRLHVPVYRGLTLTGEGSIDASAAREVRLPRAREPLRADAGGSKNVFYLPAAAQARVRSGCRGASSPVAWSRESLCATSSSSPSGSQRARSPVR
jgi:hypothetical protein